MKQIQKPIFQKRLSSIKWKKIYAREYGVQYSEMALLCLSPKANYHIPTPSVDQVIVPDGINSIFYIDEKAWNALINSLNKKYTLNITELEKYEKQFTVDGENYVALAEKIAKLDVASFSNKELLNLFTKYQDKLFTYSVFAWTSFILNLYVADQATEIIDKYITKSNLQGKRQEIIDSLFQPPQRAAILELQHEVLKQQTSSQSEFKKLYSNYKWLSCLDLHNRPWTEKQFRETIDSLKEAQEKKVTPFNKIANELSIRKKDLEYLTIAKQFVYIKDARDDFRRRGVYFVLPFFAEIAKRMKIGSKEITYVQTSEVIDFLKNGIVISPNVVNERKKGFVMYLDAHLEIVCLQTQQVISGILSSFHLHNDEAKETSITGRPACNGVVKGKVALVHGIKDLQKVQKGSILVAVTTHPDYTAAMRKAAAIITDEGGITSHAAIVSREYNIPCIVGTKNATRILKDGDEVEVNATTGVVKLIT